MPGSGAAEESLDKSLIEQELNPKFSTTGQGPITPELQQQPARLGGLPTLDPTPESLRIAYDNRSNQVSAAADHQRIIRPITPSLSSRASSVEDFTHNRHLSLQHSPSNQEDSEETSLPSTPPPYLYDEERLLSGSITQSVYNSVLSFLNMATQRQSRADDARAQETIALIKGISKIQRTHVGNVTRKLTAKQYAKFLKAIEAEDEKFQSFFIDKLRFDYTRSKKQLEIRMPTTMHCEMEEFIADKARFWRDQLKGSDDENISNAARTIKHRGSADICLAYARGPKDTKSPDWQVGHKLCRRRCSFPTLVMEVGWSQHKKDLQDKAEYYIRRSKGEIRTIVGIYMREMYQAETRNEKRLEKMYLANEVDSTSYYYEDDERNKTGSASILVWRAKTLRDGTVKAKCFQDEVFRDGEGNAIESCSLRLPLQDFICQGLVDSLAEHFEAPMLEISSGDLCENIEDCLGEYRRKRGLMVKGRVEEKKERQLQEATELAARKEEEAKSRRTSARRSERSEVLGHIWSAGQLLSTRNRGQRKS